MREKMKIDSIGGGLTNLFSLLTNSLFNQNQKCYEYLEQGSQVLCKNFIIKYKICWAISYRTQKYLINSQCLLLERNFSAFSQDFKSPSKPYCRLFYRISFHLKALHHHALSFRHYSFSANLKNRFHCHS